MWERGNPYISKEHLFITRFPLKKVKSNESWRDRASMKNRNGTPSHHQPCEQENEKLLGSGLLLRSSLAYQMEQCRYQLCDDFYHLVIALAQRISGAALSCNWQRNHKQLAEQIARYEETVNVTIVRS